MGSEFISIEEDYDRCKGETVENWLELFTKIKEEGVLAKLELKEVPLQNHFENWRDLISHSKTLKHLRICACQLTEELIDGIFNAMRENESIESLAFTYESTVASKLPQLAEIIISKPQITELDLFFSEFDNIQQVEALGNILKQNQLTKLVVGGCFGMDQSLAETFCSYLQHDNTLEYLEMNCSSHSDNGSALLAAWLEKSMTIKTLCLNNNDITEAGYNILLKALAKNTSLQELGISYNVFLDTTMKLLCAALKINETLLELHLDVKNSEDMKHLCEALKSNVSLGTLSLSYPDASLSDQVTDYLIDALDFNETLLKVHLLSPYPKKKQGEMLTKLLRNKSLRHERIEFLLVIHNIARSREALEKFPIELWLLVFDHVKIRNWRIPQMARQIFRLYN